MSTYRDDLEAAQARADALAREVAELRAEKVVKEAPPAATAPTTSSAGPTGNYGAWHRLRYDLARWPTWRKVTLIGCIVATIVTIVAMFNTSDNENQTNTWDDVAIAAGIAAAIFGGLTLPSPGAD